MVYNVIRQIMDMDLKSIVNGAAMVVLPAAGVAGVVFDYAPLRSAGPWFLALGVLLISYALLKRTYCPSDRSWRTDTNQPQPIGIRWGDYLKAFICWLDSFKRTYGIEPGLYYTGDSYDRTKPLLVTANYHLTVFLLVRRLRNLNVRLLVIDSDCINVWCAAGKGRLSNDAICAQLNRYDKDTLTDTGRISFILPKLCLSGVDLPSLRQMGYDAVIGPVYYQRIPEYLASKPYKDCDDYHVHFGLRARLFTVPPGTMQTLKYPVMVILALWLVHLVWSFKVPSAEIIAIMIVPSITYPLLFPYLPGRWFGSKGFWLGVMFAIVMVILAAAGIVSTAGLVPAVFLVVACSMNFGHGYSGNSAVSNLTSLRKEIARLLPVYVVLYIASIIAFAFTGVIL